MVSRFHFPFSIRRYTLALTIFGIRMESSVIWKSRADQPHHCKPGVQDSSLTGRHLPQSPYYSCCAVVNIVSVSHFALHLYTDDALGISLPITHSVNSKPERLPPE